MSTPLKIVMVVALTLTVAAAVAIRRTERAAGRGTQGTHPAATVAAETGLPRLLDLGAGRCVPCKAMAPILEQLRSDYSGRMTVEFIDVWKDEDAGRRHGVKMIPTQIFYDASGKELFRHTGFYGREDILGKWKELGVDLAARR